MLAFAPFGDRGLTASLAEIERSGNRIASQTRLFSLGLRTLFGGASAVALGLAALALMLGASRDRGNTQMTVIKGEAARKVMHPFRTK
jgi:hypothetical protein